MKLLIQNFSKIKQAEIEIDGITVIAGENNTGKSTVGKILYSLFNSVSNLEEKVEKQRKNEIQGTCSGIIRNYYAHNLERTESNQARYLISQHIAAYVAKELGKTTELDPGKLEQFCAREVRRALPKQDAAAAAGLVAEMLPKILELTRLPLDRIYRTLISNQFEATFSEQVTPLVAHPGETKLELIIKKKQLSVMLELDHCISFHAEYNILHRALYIDDPFVLDELDNNAIYLSTRHSEPPREHLRRVLMTESTQPQNELLETILAQEKLTEIQAVLDEVVRGQVIEKRSSGYFLEQEGMDEPVTFNNLSTGLKSFVLLKMLIENGSIKEKDVLVFDEPEIHLHPQWQLAYAQLIVLLQKYFDLSIVVTTHSPYFLDALNLYSIKHGVGPKVNYYLSFLEDGCANFENVTGNLECLYHKMATPLRVLEELRCALNEEAGGK